MRSGSILVIFTFLFEAQSYEIGGMTASLRDCSYVMYPRSHSCLVVDLVTVPHFCSRFFFATVWLIIHIHYCLRLMVKKQGLNKLF